MIGEFVRRIENIVLCLTGYNNTIQKDKRQGAPIWTMYILCRLYLKENNM